MLHPVSFSCRMKRDGKCFRSIRFDCIGNFVPYTIKASGRMHTMCRGRQLSQPHIGAQSGASPSRIEEYREFEADLPALFS